VADLLSAEFPKTFQFGRRKCFQGKILCTMYVCHKRLAILIDWSGFHFGTVHIHFKNCSAVCWIRIRSGRIRIQDGTVVLVVNQF
jgi:hypothetical protein